MSAVPASANGACSQLRRCVLLIAPKDQPDADLVTGLVRRHLRVVIVNDPPSAMLQLAAEPTTALIIATPAKQPRLDELAHAVRTYHPRTGLWRYEPSHSASAAPGLTALNGYLQKPDRTQHFKPHKPVYAESTRAGVSARLEDPLKATPVAAEADAPLISPEELAMLLDTSDVQ